MKSRTKHDGSRWKCKKSKVSTPETEKFKSTPWHVTFWVYVLKSWGTNQGQILQIALNRIDSTLLGIGNVKNVENRAEIS